MEEVTLHSLIDTVTTCSSAGKQRYCFILGAGASRASGIKTGAEMAREWLEEIEKNETKTSFQEWIEENGIDKNDPGTYYSKIYERRFRLDPASGIIRLQNEMKDALPSPGYYYLAEIIDRTLNKLVITTNFDSLTEDSLSISRDKKALVITHESLAKYINVLSERPIVIKLHRDLLLQPKNDENGVKNFHEEWKNSLKKIMDIFVPIIIGYAGNDEGFMRFLEEDVSEDKAIYWCYKKDYPVKEQIKKLLNSHNRFLIPIDNFDDTMQLFGESLKCEFSFEDIQNVTSERAEKLVNKYKECIKSRRGSLKEKETLSDTEKMAFNSFKSLSKRNISEFEKLSLKEPKNAIIYNKIGYEYHFQNDYNKAIDSYTKAIKLEPNNALYYFNRGLSWHRLKEYEKAIVDYKKAIELDPDKDLYYNRRGVSYHELKEYEKAIADKSKAIELDPNYANYYNSRGISYYLLKEYEKVIADYTKAIELDPNNAEYYNNRGISYDWLKEYEKAIADYSEAIKLDPNNVKFYRFLVRVLCRTNDFDNAQINLNKMMSLDCKSAICYNARGFFGMKKAKHDKFKCEADVLDDMNKAIELNNDTSFAAVFYGDRAEYYLYSNEPDMAYNDLQKAVVLNSLNGRIYFFMARYYEIKGNTQEYERCMDKMKECRYTPDSSDY